MYKAAEGNGSWLSLPPLRTSHIKRPSMTNKKIWRRRTIIQVFSDRRTFSNFFFLQGHRLYFSFPSFPVPAGGCTFFYYFMYLTQFFTCLFSFPLSWAGFIFPKSARDMYFARKGPYFLLFYDTEVDFFLFQ